MIKVLDYLPNKMPHDKPRYLMGVGKPETLIMAIFTITNTYQTISDKIMTVSSITSRHYTVKHTRAYLFHLEKCGEMLASMLGTIHNLRYYQRLTEGMT
jgi:queuine tRNA-ribosyltransferase